MLFSATLEGSEYGYDQMHERISKIVDKAQMVRLNPQQGMAKLDHIQQFYMKCEPKKKLDFIQSVFDTLTMTQTFVFVNSKNFALRIHETLLKAKYASFILFGNMSSTERDEVM